MEGRKLCPRLARSVAGAFPPVFGTWRGRPCRIALRGPETVRPGKAQDYKRALCRVPNECAASAGAWISTMYQKKSGLATKLRCRTSTLSACALLSPMYQKQRGLATGCENPSTSHVVEIKIVTGFPATANGAASTMCWKQKELLIDGENFSKVYIIETKPVIICSLGHKKKIVEKMSKIAPKLLKIQEAKTPIFGLSTILMKTNKLNSFSTMLMINKRVIHGGLHETGKMCCQ
jgi:hypothetical protein